MHLLYEQARRGDPAATDAVVECLKPRIARMAVYYARCSGEDPEDLLQEAWIGLLKALPELDVAIGSPDQYLITRARWHMLDVLRRARVRRSVPLDDEDAERIPSPDPESALASAFVSDFSRQLTRTQRTILRYLLAGFTWREAGRMLGCTSANIAYYVRQIRRQYEKWDSEEAAAG